MVQTFMLPRGSNALRGPCAGAAFVLASGLFGSGCDDASPVCVTHDALPPSSREGESPFGLLRCDVVPELCDRPVVSDVREPDLSVAIDLVFVPDGFGEDLDAFHERVEQLVDGIRNDPVGILHRDPTLFNVHRVDVTAGLGSCTSENHVGGSDGVASDVDRVARVAANAPDADVAIVVSRDVGGRANATLTGKPTIVNLGSHDHHVLTHELGHAIFALGDEYIEAEETFPFAGQSRSFSRILPNLSLDPNETWDGLVSGAHEGGALYAHGIYHPTDACRMGDAAPDLPFCPVCSAHIDALLAARRKLGGGTPTCGVLASPADASGRPCTAGDPGCGVDGRVVMRTTAWSPNGITDLRLFVGGMELPLSICMPAQACTLPVLVEQDAYISVPPSSAIEVRCIDGAGKMGGSAVTL